ncbi:MAG: hypothetical protein WCT04_18915 [Planctomycetota bacterium]
MDRSFLSHSEVAAAAKKFVCIRVISYEDASEKAFISTLSNREPSNTAFAILTPEGKPAAKGRGPGRGPMDLYKDAPDMAKGMDEIAAKYPLKKAEGAPALPVSLNAKVGLATAASEDQPLIVILAENAKRQEELAAKVAAMAWSKEFEGHFVYATAATAKDLPKVNGVTIKEGVVVIEPNEFGLEGKAVKEVPADLVAAKCADIMRDAMTSYKAIAKTRRGLHFDGLKAGIFYVPNLPVTAHGEAADRERYKSQLESQKKN